ncbi:MAG TPA: tetratricopeptide repeat protein [Terriglobales bacterium]|nr:tetratricopeptide repeat protein [Terriglobales bacterium]
MRTTERQQLKHDKFAETAADTYSWAVEHRNKIVYGGIIAGVVLLVVLGSLAFMNRRERQASSALSKAMEIYDAPLRQTGMPEQPGLVTFTSSAERAKAAHAEFAKIADQYSWVNSGKIARYFSGLTAKDMGDVAGAEKDLKQVADSGKQDLASLAKLALAGVYRDANKESQAIELYKQLVDRPTQAVSKSMAQLQLAELYQTKQPQEAAKLYEQIRKDDPQSVAAEIAARNMSTLK